MQHIRASVFVVGLLAACAGGRAHVDVTPAEVPFAAPSSGNAEAAVTPAPTPDEGAAVLTRAVMRRTVEQGIGAFLAGVELTPVLSGGRFTGFRIDHARDLRRWNAAGMSLREGDVVTRINGQAIERPEQAQAVFVRMATADAVIVDVLRDGAPVTLRTPVVVDAPAVVSDASVAAPRPEATPPRANP